MGGLHRTGVVGIVAEGSLMRNLAGHQEYSFAVVLYLGELVYHDVVLRQSSAGLCSIEADFFGTADEPPEQMFWP